MPEETPCVEAYGQSAFMSFRSKICNGLEHQSEILIVTYNSPECVK